MNNSIIVKCMDGTSIDVPIPKNSNIRDLIELLMMTHDISGNISIFKLGCIEALKTNTTILETLTSVYCLTTILTIEMITPELWEYIKRYNSNVTNISDLHNLQELVINNCTELIDLTPLSHLTNLQKLNMNNCIGITDITSLSNLTNLQLLFMYNCTRINDIAPLSNLTKCTINYQ